MNKFYIISNSDKEQAAQVTEDIRRYLIDHGKEVMFYPSSPAGNNHSYTYTDPSLFPDDVDCVVVLGGDGTLTHAARDLAEKGLPLIGVNLGTLGYLAELDLNSLFTGLDRLMNNDFITEKRMMLKGAVRRGKETIFTGNALNDIVLSRSDALKIVVFRIYVNGEFLNEYRADGIIAATPTGSTAYNLSAGGPILDPTSSMIVLTPISYHSMISRSIVLSDMSKIKMEVVSVGSPKTRITVGFDGDSLIDLIPGDEVLIEKSSLYTKVLKINKINFLETLRKKMGQS